MTMKTRVQPFRAVVSILALTVGLALAAPGLGTPIDDSDDEAKKVAERARNAGVVLGEIADAPDQRIPRALLEEAHCLAVIPKVVKAGFVVAGRHGKGLMTCRIGDDWSRPAYVSLTGGSVGLQIGAQATDFVLVFAEEGAVEHVYDGQFTLGGDASVSAGPVGRTAEAGTDVKLDSEIYTYSRSKGVFAGVSIEGAGFKIDGDANRVAYGAEVSARELLTEAAASLPDSIAAFIDSVRRIDPGHRHD